MTDHDATGWITRTGLTLPDLALFAPGALPARQDIPVYDFGQDGLSIGATVKRRQIAESMYMDDDVQVQVSRGRATSQLNMLVTGHDHDSLQSNFSAFRAAVEDQATWELHVLFGGTTEWAWSYRDAEVTPTLSVPAWYGRYMLVLVTATRSPVPVAGPI